MKNCLSFRFLTSLGLVRPVTDRIGADRWAAAAEAAAAMAAAASAVEPLEATAAAVATSSWDTEAANSWQMSAAATAIASS